MKTILNPKIKTGYIGVYAKNGADDYPKHKH